MSTREKCLEARLTNPQLGYAGIAKLIGVTKESVRYHLNAGYRDRFKHRQSKNRKLKIDALKLKFGGRCSICGYDRCLEALHFHHRNPDGKSFGISGKRHGMGANHLISEAEKCDLICANCHAELHAGLRLERLAEVSSAT
jgi:hypothetical protein